MKKIVFFLTGFAITSNALASIPAVRLTYAETFDSVCTQETQYKIDPSWVSELRGRVPELQSSWQVNGSVLLKTAQEVVGKDFVESEFKASLSVCSFPSMSNPLLINMRYSLRSFTSTPLPGDVTVSIIFHEILHSFLIGKIPVHSAMLEKYKSEDGTVLSHLHLFALQKATYLKLGMGETLNRVIAKDQSLPNKSYARAWEIVNAIEGYPVFIRELQQ